MKKFEFLPRAIEEMTYICPICGKSSPEYSEIASCIEGHPNAATILGFESWNNSANTPYDLVVELSDGRIARYGLIGIKTKEEEQYGEDRGTAE
ncbi:MAG: hypothetical protein ABFC57_06325 [Veillonellales bacterium]